MPSTAGRIGPLWLARAKCPRTCTEQGSRFGASAASRRRLEDALAVAGVGGGEGGAWLDDLVDAVERRGVEDDVGGGELAVELLHRAGPDDRRGHAWVVDDEGDRQVDPGKAGGR